MALFQRYPIPNVPRWTHVQCHHHKVSNSRVDLPLDCPRYSPSSSRSFYWIHHKFNCREEDLGNCFPGKKPRFTKKWRNSYRSFRISRFFQDQPKRLNAASLIESETSVCWFCGKFHRRLLSVFWTHSQRVHPVNPLLDIRPGVSSGPQQWIFMFCSKCFNLDFSSGNKSGQHDFWNTSNYSSFWRISRKVWCWKIELYRCIRALMKEHCICISDSMLRSLHHIVLRTNRPALCKHMGDEKMERMDTYPGLQNWGTICSVSIRWRRQIVFWY